MTADSRRTGRPQPRTYVSDLTHFLDERGDIVDGLPGKMGAYLARIVETGFLLPAGQGTLAAALCSNPSRRRRCRGRLGIVRASDERIEWECQRCGENGVIHNWAGTRFDLSSVPARGPSGVSVVVLAHELWSLRCLGEGTPELRALVAVPLDIDEGYVSFAADFADVGELIELCERGADAARGEERRRLDRLGARFDAFRTTLPDFIEPDEPGVDLAALEEAGHSPELIALARMIAAEHGRDIVLFEDVVEAEEAWKRGRRPLLH